MNPSIIIKGFGGLFIMLSLCLSGISQGPSKDSLSIYLTFDDGPTPASYELVNLVEKDSVKITVFLVGLHVASIPEGKTVSDAYRANPLVEIGNHSYSHASKKYKRFYSHAGQVIDDIRKNEDSLQLSNKIVRLPGRNVWRLGNRKRNDLKDAGAAADSLACLGYQIYGWDLEWQYDTTTKAYPAAQTLLDHIELSYRSSFVPGHVIILCHDWMLVNEYALEQLKLFIEAVRARGWKFRHLVEYPYQREIPYSYKTNQ